VEVLGLLSSKQTVANNGVFIDADQAGGLTDAATLGQVMQDGKDLVFGQTGIEQRGAFAFGEAILARAAIEEASLRQSIVTADGQVAVAAFTEVRAVRVETAENAEVVHGGSVPSKGEGVAVSLPSL
jgi:hypothetical protein